MSAAATTFPASEHEEDCEAALRVALGLRPHVFESNEPPIDCRPCPHWCHYGQEGNDHEIQPDRPFDAHHGLGVTPSVALSLYPGEWHRPIAGCSSYKSAATLDVRLNQRGTDAPTIALHLRLSDRDSRPEPLKLAVNDARDLITALQYVVDLVDSARTVVEGAE